MRLVSKDHQQITVGEKTFSMVSDEYIVTEHSHKYTLEGFREMAEMTGFVVEKIWTDPARLFSVQFCTRM